MKTALKIAARIVIGIAGVWLMALTIALAVIAKHAAKQDAPARPQPVVPGDPAR